MLLLAGGRQLAKVYLQEHFSEGSRNTDNSPLPKGTLGSFLNLGRQSKTKSALVIDGKPKRCQFMYRRLCSI